MKKEEILALFKSYEDAVYAIDNTECWSARELCTLLGYQQWRNFVNVIDKAKDVSNNAGQAVPEQRLLEVERVKACAKPQEAEQKFRAYCMMNMVPYRPSKRIHGNGIDTRTGEPFYGLKFD